VHCGDTSRIGVSGHWADCAAAISSGLAFRQPPAQKLRQLGDIHRNPPRFVTSKQLARGPATALVLAIDEGERLFVGVAAIADLI
jgi:hypothetical protein